MPYFSVNTRVVCDFRRGKKSQRSYCGFALPKSLSPTTWRLKEFAALPDNVQVGSAFADSTTGFRPSEIIQTTLLTLRFILRPNSPNSISAALGSWARLTPCPLLVWRCSEVKISMVRKEIYVHLLATTCCDLWCGRQVNGRVSLMSVFTRNCSNI